MKSLPPELLIGLLLVLVYLGQHVIQRIRQSRNQQGRPEALPQAPAEQVPGEPPRGEQWDSNVPPAAPVTLPATTARSAPEYRMRRREASAMRGPRRFSRTTLMGDRRKLQDAMIIAAIVGPCRAMEPHDIRQ